MQEAAALTTGRCQKDEIITLCLRCTLGMLPVGHFLRCVLQPGLGALAAAIPHQLLGRAQATASLPQRLTLIAILPRTRPVMLSASASAAASRGKVCAT